MSRPPLLVYVYNIPGLIYFRHKEGGKSILRLPVGQFVAGRWGVRPSFVCPRCVITAYLSTVHSSINSRYYLASLFLTLNTRTLYRVARDFIAPAGDLSRNLVFQMAEDRCKGSVSLITWPVPVILGGKHAQFRPAGSDINSALSCNGSSYHVY